MPEVLGHEPPASRDPAPRIRVAGRELALIVCPTLDPCKCGDLPEEILLQPLRDLQINALQ
jgi:hypothetical protein